MSFEDLRQEYLDQVIGELIFGIVTEISAAICRKYPEKTYNNGLAWDKGSITDLAQDVVLNQLLDEGQLDYIFSVADNVESVRRLITHQVKRALHRRRSVTVIDRLIRRIAALADSGRLERMPGSLATYRPVGSDAQWQPMTPQQETDAINAAATIPVRYSRLDARRESPVYSQPALEKALQAFFGVCPALTEQEIRRILEKLLTPWGPTHLIPIEEAPESQEVPMTAIAIDELDGAAAAWVNSLTHEECAVFYYRSRNLPDIDVATHIKKSRGTVINIKKRVLESAKTRLLADHDPSLHHEAVKLAQEHCARRLGDSL